LIEAKIKEIRETCARSEINITDGITKEVLLYYCKGCDRYLRPPWVRCGSSLDSNVMMEISLGKIKGLNKRN
jgi:nonsense-mediated mRNA decay protein 3